MPAASSMSLDPTQDSQTGSLQILIDESTSGKMPSLSIESLRSVMTKIGQSADSPTFNNGFRVSPGGDNSCVNVSVTGSTTNTTSGPDSPSAPTSTAQGFQPIIIGAPVCSYSAGFVPAAQKVVQKSVTFAPSTIQTQRRSAAQAFADRSLHIQSKSAPDTLGPDDIPPVPPHPTDPAEIRALVRSKMHRCHECKNRFVERHLYERHLQRSHAQYYELYSEEQRKENEAQRLFELQETKREELISGGFIPPMSQIDAALNFSDLDPNTIPLPGEETNGRLPTFDRWGGIRMPRRTYKKKVSPQCVVCDKRFRNEYSLKKHICKKHPEWTDFIQCNKCFKALKNDLEINTHECTLDLICFECTPIRNMVTQERLDSHRCKFHRGRNSGFPCPECKRRFLTPRKLRKHKIMYHVIKNPFKCHFCDEYFASENKVSMHERIHTGKIKYECDICDYRCNRWPRLEKHKRIEHGYVCAICQEKTVEWSQLKMHTLDKHGGYLSSEASAPVVDSPRVWVMYKGE